MAWQNLSEDLAEMFGSLDVFEVEYETEKRSYHFAKGLSLVKGHTSQNYALNGPHRKIKKKCMDRLRADPKYKAKEYAKNEEWRKKKRAADPHYVEKQRARERERYARRMAEDPAFKEKLRAKSREAMRARRAQMLKEPTISTK